MFHCSSRPKVRKIINLKGLRLQLRATQIAFAEVLSVLFYFLSNWIRAERYRLKIETKWRKIYFSSCNHHISILLQTWETLWSLSSIVIMKLCKSLGSSRTGDVPHRTISNCCQLNESKVASNSWNFLSF